MNALVPILLVFCAAAVRTDESSNAMVANAFNKCNTQFPLSDSDMAKLKAKDGVPDSQNAKCVLACLLKEGKILIGGTYSTPNALLMADILNKDDQAIAEKAKQLVQTCVDKVGTDVGSDECQFAYNMAVCASDEAKKLGVRPPDF